MQAIAPVTIDQLLASDQNMKAKVEIWVDSSWINLSDLDSKNYVQDWSISLGGASMTPNPVGGTWSVTLSNENGIFHPLHPTSGYEDYLKAGRKVRISIGGKYSGTDYYWQRMIGYMEEPNFDIAGAEVTISGSDYMKFLQDTEFRASASPNHNYWGTSATFNSISSEGFTGIEHYNEADAMDITGEADNVTNWTPTNCTFVSLAEVGGGSSYVGKIVTDASAWCDLVSGEIFTPTAGTKYAFQFKTKRVSVGGDEMYLDIIQGGRVLIEEHEIYHTTTGWHITTVYFTTENTDPIEIIFHFLELSMVNEYWLDQFSFHAFIPYWERYYELPSACKGIYRVVLNDQDVWHGGDDGWHYTKDAEPGPDPPAHPARIVWFDVNKEVSAGSNNLVIHYFTTTAMEDVVADLLVTAGLYVDRATAKADMDYTDPAIDIDQVWFDTGKPTLDGMRMVCERCDYRFHFAYGGKPTFKPKPSGATAFTFTDHKHIASPRRYVDKSEIKNRIVIEGKSQQEEAFYQEESLSSEFRGEAYDQTSIDAYGERTLPIKNHLFQDQTSLDNMCASLLAEYKDPKWYVDFDVPYNPVPLELRDKTSWKERLSPVLDITASGYIRDFKITKFDSTFKCVTV